MTKQFACLYPGQGSQSVGMLADWLTPNTVAQGVFQQASQQLGYDILALVQQGPKEQLDQTVHTQPAMLAAGVAAYKTWLSHDDGRQFSFAAGHSLGEYTALVCANALTFGDAIKLVAERGRLMQQAVPSGQGAMAAIVGLQDGQVIDICKQAAQGQLVAPANYNAIGQVVIAGEVAAVDRAILLAKQNRARMAKKIPVSVPCHTELLKSAAEEFAHFLQITPVKQPTLPVISNVDVSLHQHPDDIRESLKQQLYKPVRWVEVIQRIVQEGVNTMVECGPGKVLSGLTKRIDRTIKSYPIYDNETLDKATSALNQNS